MEEILASIRRIISDDEAEPAPAAALAPSKPALVEKLAQPAPEPHSPPAETPSAPREPRAEVDAHPHLETEDVEMITKNVAAAMDEDAGETILGATSADAASSAFMALSETVRVSDGGGRTLEDIVVAMLKPMVKEWLDANLPTIVEEKVEEEVQRVARRRR
ncbi:MAG: DUF2497 domain-containing protein [Alphaproteobacteria bacterium]|nr:DUF2497 domain-containing protein [Alphaproteobacteria bacterium]